MSTRGTKLAGIDTTLSRPKVSPPTELNQEAKKIWRRIVNNMPNDHFNQGDFAMLSAYCENYLLMLEAREEMEKGGKVLMDHNAKLYPNPWVGIHNTAAGKIAQIGVKLRLTPSARGDRRDTKEKSNAKKTTKLGKLIG